MTLSATTTYDPTPAIRERAAAAGFGIMHRRGDQYWLVPKEVYSLTDLAKRFGITVPKPALVEKPVNNNDPYGLRAECFKNEWLIGQLRRIAPKIGCRVETSWQKKYFTEQDRGGLRLLTRLKGVDGAVLQGHHYDLTPTDVLDMLAWFARSMGKEIFQAKSPRSAYGKMLAIRDLPGSSSK